jgi:hypothetical protein
VGFGSGAGCDSGFDFFSRAFAVSAGFVVSGCWAKTPAHKAHVSTNEQVNRRMISPEENDLNCMANKAGPRL